MSGSTQLIFIRQQLCLTEQHVLT